VNEGCISATHGWTVEMALPEDGANKRQSESEYWSNIVTWCMNGGALTLIVLMWRIG